MFLVILSVVKLSVTFVHVPGVIHYNSSRALISRFGHKRTGRGAGGLSSPSRKNNSIIRAKLMYRSGNNTVKNILLFNILIYLFLPRNSPNLLTDPLYNFTGWLLLLGVRTLSSAEGLGVTVIIKIALGLELRMSWRPC